MRKINTVAASALVFCPLLFSQSGQEPKPTLPAEILGPPLVAWSEMQAPHPLLQLVPPAEGPNEQHQEANIQDFKLQSFSVDEVCGVITREGTKHVLKVSENTSIQIDDQDDVGAYEGMRVKIAGVLEAAKNLLHITSIELLS